MHGLNFFGFKFKSAKLIKWNIMGILDKLDQFYPKSEISNSMKKRHHPSCIFILINVDKYIKYFYDLNKKGIYELTQPGADWIPAFDTINTQVEKQADPENLSIAVNNNPNNVVSISIGIKYGENGHSNFNFDFTEDLRETETTL